VFEIMNILTDLSSQTAVTIDMQFGVLFSYFIKEIHHVLFSV